MRFGVQVPHVGLKASPDGIAAVAQRVEALGLDSVWVSDHLVIPTQIESKYPGTASGRFVVKGNRDFYEPLATMAFLAGVTDRVRIGVSVLVIPYRNPVVQAKQIATIDALSKCRVLLGVGVGWMPEEFAAVDAPPFADRGPATDEYLEIFRKLWTGEPVSHQGTYYQFDEIQSNPKPANLNGIPIWVGGYSTPAYRRAAKYGQAWHGIRFTPETVRGPIAAIRRHAEAIGRDPAEIEITTKMAVDATGRPRAESPTGEPDRFLFGTPEEMAETIRAFEAAGVSELILTFWARELEDFLRDLDYFGKEVLPLTTS